MKNLYLIPLQNVEGQIRGMLIVVASNNDEAYDLAVDETNSGRWDAVSHGTAVELSGRYLPKDNKSKIIEAIHY